MITHQTITLTLVLTKIKLYLLTHSLTSLLEATNQHLQNLRVLKIVTKQVKYLC